MLAEDSAQKGGPRKVTRTVNVHEAKTHLSRLLDRVSQGEEIIVAKAGKPVARLVSVEERVQRREPGSASGRIVVSEDFDAPLSEEVLESFER
jgi:prevent-host-death family protein